MRELKVRLVVLWSQTGATARVFSKHRLPVPVIAFSSDPAALRRMSLQYGVTPREMPVPAGVAALIVQADAMLLDSKLAAAGDRVLIVAGSATAAPGTINGIIVHTVGESGAELRGAAQGSSLSRS